MYIGVDLGGTNIGVGLVDSQGKIIHKDETPTGVGRPFGKIIKDMAELINKVIKDSGYTNKDILAIGIGSPGLPEKEKGLIIFSNNLDWHNVPLRDELQKYFDIPIHIENDGNTAGFAEVVAGACKGALNSIVLTLGTGIGSGIVIDGKPYSGTHWVGAEIGHMIVQVDGIECSCGNKGCWERYASATAIIREGKRAATENPDSLMNKLVKGDIEQITAKTVIDAAKEGDRVALEVFNEFIKYLAMGIISIINCFDPEIIAIGGGVAKAGDFLMGALQKKVDEHIFYKEAPYAKIVRASLGNDAGIIGAAMLGRE